MSSEETSSLSQKELVQLLAEYKSLAKLPAWGRLYKLWEEQIALRGSEILARDERSLEDFIETATLKAERRGLLLGTSLLDAVISQIENELEEIRDAENTRTST